MLVKLGCDNLVRKTTKSNGAVVFEKHASDAPDRQKR